MRLRPTWSLAFATPRGRRSVRDWSSSFGVSIPCAAITNTVATAWSSLPSGRVMVSEAMRPSGPTATWETTDSATSSAPARSAWAT